MGSVGVISATFGATAAAARLGIERRVFTAGEAKLQLDPFLPVTPEAVSRPHSRVRYWLQAATALLCCFAAVA